MVEVVRAAQHGDRAAFAQIYEQYERMIHGILLSYVRPQEARDLVQSVFLIALERLGTLSDSAALGSWLVTVARNTAVDHHRRQRTESSLLETHAVSHPPRLEAYRVLDEIKKLPEAYRETLVLRLVEGMTGAEIAEHTGLKPESVRVNLTRGMRMLRERLS